MNDVARPCRRRWYQFSLRSMLIFVLVVSLPLGWFARRMDCARRQRAAVEAIWKEKGSVGYDFARDPERQAHLSYLQFLYPHELQITALEAYGESWTRDLFGCDFSFRVVSVVFPTIYPTTTFPVPMNVDPRYLRIQETGSDANLALLKPLSDLREIYTCGPEVTDKGLVHLTDFADLEYLGLGHTSVTDEGLTQLHSMRQLRRVYISSSQVTARGIQHLRDALPECEIEFDPRP